MLASLKDIQTLVSELEFDDDSDEVVGSEGEEEDWEEVEEKKE